MSKTSSDESEARDRLLAAARKRGTSLAALSRLIGRNAAYLQQFVARGSPRHLDEPDLRRIAEFLGIDAGQIATRKTHPSTDGGERSSENYLAIPRLALDASAGPGRIGAQEIPFDTYRFSRRWLRENGLEGSQLSAVRVEGDSMEPLLRSGDEIFVDHTKRAGEGVFVVRIGEALHVKQVQASAPGMLKLVSANEGYAPVELPRGEVEIIGRVVWKGGRI